MTTATMTAKCTHERTKQIGPDRCYVGSVAVYPFTDDNPMAAGNITYTEECQQCGARREVNNNQWHFEFGPFGPTAAERKAEELRVRAAKKAKQKADDDAILAKYGVKIVRHDGPSVLLDVRGERSWLSLWDAERAAEQPDNGDDIVPVYSALARAIRESIA